MQEELQTERHILTTFDEVRSGVIDVAARAKRNITTMTADLEPDGMDNLTEWALGGNPLSNDAVSLIIFNADERQMSLSYKRRHRADELGLAYHVVTTTNLVNGTWTTDGVGETAAYLNTEFEAVSNSVPVDVDAKFLGLTLSEL